MPGKTNGGKDNARQTAADDPDESECKQVDDGETLVFGSNRAAGGAKDEQACKHEGG